LAQGLAAHAEAGVGGGQNRRRRLNCQKLAPQPEQLAHRAAIECLARWALRSRQAGPQ